MSLSALHTDLYEIAMLQAYWREGMDGEAVFSLFVRSLPESRNYLLACGLETVLDTLERLRFTAEDRNYLASLPQFSPEFLDWLDGFRFQGAVHALPEGTPVFPLEPLLEVVAPLPQAQLVESLVMNQVHMQTVLASKAARVVEAAAGRPVVDFALRRMHGTDAALAGARAFHIAGVAATSNVLAGYRHGIPVAGTMAHSYIQAHDDEKEALRSFASLYPGTILLVDTYDTEAGVRTVADLARKDGMALEVKGVRLDSGDLAEGARRARRILDRAGLNRVEIFVSGGLDETRVAAIVASGAPVDGFGVGSKMGVSADAPSLDMAYKLTSYAGRGRVKLSPGKASLPGRKQVHRQERSGEASGDILALAEEEAPGRPLLRPVFRDGRPLPEARQSLDAVRQRARREIDRLPATVRALPPAPAAYPVRISRALAAALEAARRRARAASGS